MEFSCHSWAFTDQPVTEALGTIARLGFRYADLGTGPHLNLLDAVSASKRVQLFQEIRTALKIFNLQLADLYLFLPRIAYAAEKKRQTDITLFKGLLPFAKGLRTPGITVSPGLIQPDADEGAWQRCIAALREMQSAAQEAGIALSIEPHLDSMAATPSKALQLLEEIKGLQLTLDWAHLHYQGIDLKSITELLPHTRHIQIRQAKPGTLQTPFEEGTIDLKQVISTLHQSGYSGIVSVETMQTIGWHGMRPVNSILESIRLRDVLREARDSQVPHQSP